ncbi:hypothetical protein [Okeania sp. SIO2B3]|uniref:hypothetical protein n=1 Tax=Okeania sp. SIO2B3 TaxID=2607784 RepID=UPI0013C013A8|nr:hypothetical protein [Okeania sp. SIO2B3]NET47100.1 hypothetical protein [Okeania sp. SIO2B3]
MRKKFITLTLTKQTRILTEIESTINALYGLTGEYIGQQVAVILVGGLFNPPKVQINVRALSLAWDITALLRKREVQL